MDLVPNTPPDSTDRVHWSGSWGDQIKVNDLIKVTKLGGPVRVVSLRRFEQTTAQPFGGGHQQTWYYGAVVADKTGKEFHVAIQPVEPVFIGIEVPAHLSDDSSGDEVPGPDGV